MMELVPDRTAMVVVHLQGDVVTHEGAFGSIFAEMVDESGVLGRGAELLACARKAGATVIYMRMVFSEGHPELVVTAPLWALVEETGAFVDGSPGAAIVPEVAPAPGDVVVDHHRADGAFESSLVEELESRGVDTAIFLGVATNVSVEATARSLGDHGYRVIVATDACTAGDQATHEAAIATLGLLVSDLAAGAEIAAALGAGVAG
jgi:nicotinamidase-related amidase